MLERVAPTLLALGVLREPLLQVDAVVVVVRLAHQAGAGARQAGVAGVVGVGVLADDVAVERVD